MAVEYTCCETGFFIRILIVTVLVLFAGLMSGLTLGLMSLSLVDLEVLSKSGTPTDRKHAAKILPVVKRQHLLLCTLLICNAAAMEVLTTKPYIDLNPKQKLMFFFSSSQALPIFLDSLVTAWGAILISVTLILIFGEIIPQAVCSRYGLAIGAAVAPVVRVLVWICFPVAYPISKLLDFLLGKQHHALFRRAELKTLVDLHSNEAGKGGELTRDETMIIAGALQLTEKTARDVMTPITETFAIELNAKLDRDLMDLIIEKGHSRVPVYYENPSNIIGLILVKNLLTINLENEMPIKNITMRKIPRVSETMPLYDLLNEFQKGHSHMAAVVKQFGDADLSASKNPTQVREVRVDVSSKRHSRQKNLKSKGSLKKFKSLPKEANASTKSKRWLNGFHSEVLQITDEPLQNLSPEGEAIAIVTLEDVIEELLQEEIYDETDNRDDS